MPAVAETSWDVSIPWGPNEFHTKNAVKFAEEVAAATKGEVKMTVHAGGSLGIRANESLRAVEDGAVPMAEYGLFQNTGDVPLLGIEAIPFLIKNYEEVRVMHGLVRPLWEAELEKRNQKILYIVPWPSQNFFTKEPIDTPEDMKGMRMRVMDNNTAEMVTRLGMTATQLNNPDIVPALATGRLDAVMTSGTTAAAQQYWEFLKHVYNTNHLWASNGMVVNLDSWNELTPEQQTAIEEVAARLEPTFWEISEGEHSTRMEELKSHGMTVQAPSEEVLQMMRDATEDMRPAFIERAPAAGPILEEFLKVTGE
ncbi:TRAP transporter substrate-binding protein (plasmid) [Sulfitobacter sp. LCG007]